MSLQPAMTGQQGWQKTELLEPHGRVRGHAACCGLHGYKGIFPSPTLHYLGTISASSQGSETKRRQRNTDSSVREACSSWPRKGLLLCNQLPKTECPK